MRHVQEMELRYSQLAKSNATISRNLSGTRLKRLLPLCQEVHDFEVQLSFELTQDSEVLVSGQVSGTLSTGCLRCNESVLSSVCLPIDLFVFETEEQVESWISKGQSTLEREVVVSGPVLELLDLVEDELILRLPQVVCSVCNSDNKENYVYSAGPEPEKASPFSELSEWVSK